MSIEFEVTSDSTKDTGHASGTISLSVEQAKNLCSMYSNGKCLVRKIGQCDLNNVGKCRRGSPLIAKSSVKNNPNFVPKSN